MVYYANFLYENISWVRKNQNPTEPLTFQIYCRKFRRIRVEHSALLQHGAGPSEPKAHLNLDKIEKLIKGQLISKAMFYDFLFSKKSTISLQASKMGQIRKVQALYCIEYPLITIY